jgi:peptide/nickel transport system substrate-binding protein
LQRVLVIACLAIAAAVFAVSARGQAAQHKPSVFDVGNTQDIDSMNPLVGVTVQAYEAWNMQYEGLTEKSPKDFTPQPGLAQSWKPSADKRTWTYTLRPNLKWSDGQPLTSADVAYTINTARKQSWLNYTATVSDLVATAPNPRTVVVHSTVPDPKLPVVDVYILPQHIWGKLSKSAITKYAADDGVGSGPFVLDHREKGQFARFKANPHFWKGRPKVDEVILRNFDNPDAMVAALETGELDAAENVPGTGFHKLEKNPKIETLQGYQGGIGELALNGGAGLKKPHPALLDPRVRKAISYAIDRQTIVNRVLDGVGKPAELLGVSPNPAWEPTLAPAERYRFDLAKARQILDAAGYKDTDGDGIREMPGGGHPLIFRYAVRSEGDTGPGIAEYVSGWLKQIGIGTKQSVYNDSRLTEVVGKGDYDMFAWGWTPFVDPDPMLSYFTCSQVAHDPKDPTNYYNDANWCDKRYDALYKQQKTELDPAKRRDIVHRMLRLFHDSDVYQVLYDEPDAQAIVKGRFTGFVRQPAGVGPVLYSQTSPSYARLAPVVATAGASKGGGGAGTIVAIVLAAVVVLGGGALWLRRRRTAYERE